MREIKYRVYIKELNNIFEVNTMTFLDEGIRVFIKGNDTRNYLIDGKNNVLLEYIGIKAINGDFIYSGDIISGITTQNRNIVEGAVVFNNNKGYYEIKLSGKKLKALSDKKIIGNKYLNPELGKK